MSNRKIYFIGIAGPTGSGKTALCKELTLRSKDFEHVRLDNYFKDPKTFPKKHGFLNYEKPSNLKIDIALKHLEALKSGKHVYTKSFPKETGGVRKSIVLRPRKVILVEGFLLFKNRELREFLDVKIYLDIPSELILQRRAMRSDPSYNHEYDVNVAVPEFLKYGIVQKKYADYVIDATRTHSQVMHTVQDIIKSELQF